MKVKVEKRRPPFRNALPKKRTPVPMKDFNSIKTAWVTVAFPAGPTELRLRRERDLDLDTVEDVSKGVVSAISDKLAVNVVDGMPASASSSSS